MLERRTVMSAILEHRTSHWRVVSGLGSPTWDLAAVSRAEENFHFIGAMGQSAAFALGLALAQPDRRVVLFTGDGELLMGLGTLATIANAGIRNLALVVLDNESYQETGGQRTATAGQTDLAGIAAACGFASSSTLRETSEVGAAGKLIADTDGPVMVVAKVIKQTLPMVFPPSFDGSVAMEQFRRAIT